MVAMQPRPELTALTDEVLAGWLVERRWFASKGRDIASFRVLDVVPLTDGPPALQLLLVETRFPTGHHEVYQVIVGLRPAAEGFAAGVIAEAGGQTIYDAAQDPEACRLLAGLLAEGGDHRGPNAEVRFRWVGERVERPAGGDARNLGAEQSNTSLVLDGRVILKAYRRLEAGENPELEMVRFLESHGFDAMPPLGGWYEISGELMDATLGVAQAFMAGARDGWDWVLDTLVTDPALVTSRMRDLGAVVGRMHAILGSDATDPDFAPEALSDEVIGLLTATVDEEIERVWLDLPRNDARVEDIAGRGEEVRDRLQLMSHVGVGGRAIRHHGDLHLGQTLLGDDGWVVLDFEGEPARPLLERRRKRSPLRDVAGMLRSFAYAASAAEIQRGAPAPEGWEDEARTAFLAGYHETVDATLLPPGEAATAQLLSIFELEKAVYELRYELANRPDWVRIPVAGIRRLLDADLP
jgi:maltokinase